MSEPHVVGWLADVLADARDQVAEWPEWKRSDEARQALRELAQRREKESNMNEIVKTRPIYEGGVTSNDAPTATALSEEQQAVWEQWEKAVREVTAPFTTKVKLAMVLDREAYAQEVTKGNKPYLSYKMRYNLNGCGANMEREVTVGPITGVADVYIHMGHMWNWLAEIYLRHTLDNLTDDGKSEADLATESAVLLAEHIDCLVANGVITLGATEKESHVRNVVRRVLKAAGKPFHR